MDILDKANIGILVSLGVDVLLAYGMYKYYKRALRSSEKVQRAENIKIGPQLLNKLEGQPDRTIPYGCVEGVVVGCKGAPLKSQHQAGIEGVVQQSSLVEHRSRRVQGVWSDTKRIIRDSLDTVPFYLGFSMNSESERVLVTEPTEADYIMDDLTVTHESYNENESNLLQKGFDLIAGEVSKGLEESEKMLLVGTHLVAIGKIVKDETEVTVKPPDNRLHYIITKKTKDEVIKMLQKKATIFKVFLFIFGGVGVGLVVYLIYRLFKKWKSRSQTEQMRRNIQATRERVEARRARLANRNQTEVDHTGAGDFDADKCVICLTNNREVVLLECGHICLCGDCALCLPEPKLCPICRQSVDRFISTYLP